MNTMTILFPQLYSLIGPVLTAMGDIMEARNRNLTVRVAGTLQPRANPKMCGVSFCLEQSKISMTS